MKMMLDEYDDDVDVTDFAIEDWCHSQNLTHQATLVDDDGARNHFCIQTVWVCGCDDDDDNDDYDADNDDDDEVCSGHWSEFT